MTQGWLETAREGDVLTLTAGGGWTLPSAGRLDVTLRSLSSKDVGRRVTIALARLEALDTAGAWLLERTVRALKAHGASVEITGGSAEQRALIEQIRRVDEVVAAADARPNPLLAAVARVGVASHAVVNDAGELLSFFGAISLAFARLALRPWRLRLTSVVSHLEQSGLNAVPIVVLIAFLIGIVLAYQGASELRRFGAEIFTINLLGLSILREIGILLTAIMVAGRSGSAFAAQIGTMQVNEEVDALRTLGLDPVEVLVVPRLLAMMLALPLLAFLANVAALVGGGVMCLLVLDISPTRYLIQLSEAVTPVVFWAGLAKAPVFAFLIGMVGCHQGMRVSGSAESVGLATTKSVVVSIFLVIVVDAVFSVLYASFGI